jgi:hypothetical protein
MTVSEVPGAGSAGTLGRKTLALQAAVVVVLAVAVGLGLSTLLRGPSTGPVALVPSLAVASPSPTVTPMPATPSPAPTGARTPTPRPTPVPIQQVALDRFWALISKPDFGYHMDVTGNTTAGKSHSRFRYSIDVTGGDFGGTITHANLAMTCHGVRKSGRIYAWCPNGLKGSHEDSGGLWSFWPFMGLTDRSNLNPPKLVKVNGGTLVHLTSSGSYATGIDRMLNTNVSPDTGYPVSVELWITTAGIPVKAVFRLGPVAIIQETASGNATYVFTHVGRKVVIRPPW